MEVLINIIILSSFCPIVWQEPSVGVIEGSMILDGKEWGNILDRTLLQTGGDSLKAQSQGLGDTRVTQNEDHPWFCTNIPS